jgi:hypothetical protein
MKRPTEEAFRGRVAIGHGADTIDEHDRVARRSKDREETLELRVLGRATYGRR